MTNFNSDLSSLTVESLAAAIWDARESSDPSGELIGFTKEDERREPVYWTDAVAHNRWPGSRDDQLREARLVLEILGLVAPDEIEVDREETP